jgi:sulfonate transport system permease protein
MPGTKPAGLLPEPAFAELTGTAPADTGTDPAGRRPPDGGLPAGPAAAPGATSAATAAPATGPVRKAAAGRRDRGWYRWLSPAAFLLLWQLLSMSGLVSEQKLPPPALVWHTAVTLVTTTSPAYGTLQGAMLVSLQRMAIGFAAGGSIAVLLAVIAGLSRLGENAVDPLMQMLRTLPLFGLIPVFIVWFGIGELPKIALIALGAAIPLYLNTFAGIRQVDGRLAEVGQVLGLRRREMIWHIVLPGALPQVLVGVRQSLGVAWLALVVAEQVNANAGLGFIISQATQFLRNDMIFVALLVYCLLGLLTDAIVRLLERRALTWRRGLLAQ